MLSKVESLTQNVIDSLFQLRDLGVERRGIPIKMHYSRVLNHVNQSGITQDICEIYVRTLLFSFYGYGRRVWKG